MPVKPPRAPSVLKAAMPVARAFPNKNVAGQLQIGPSEAHIHVSHQAQPPLIIPYLRIRLQYIILARYLLSVLTCFAIKMHRTGLKSLLILCIPSAQH